MVSDEQGKRFHQDIQLIERRYQGIWSESMMANYCWMLYNDNPDTKYKNAMLSTFKCYLIDTVSACLCCSLSVSDSALKQFFFSFHAFDLV